MNSVSEIMCRAWQARLVIPAFNIPYLPMMAPVIEALREARCFGLVAVARPDWEKFEAKGIGAVREEYERVRDRRCTGLHLDHVPVIDEDGHRVDHEAIFRAAIDLGYESVMVDGSRLRLEENIAATRGIVEMAHEAGVPVEAELGSVMGHEEGPLPPYEELFASGKGFTDVGEAARFVAETRVDWLSVAVGNIHGAISKTRRHEKKAEARLSIERIGGIAKAARVPLVLHGGSGIRRDDVLTGIRHGIAKINIGTAMRQAYEENRTESVAAAQEAVRRAALKTVREDLELEGTLDRVNP